MAQVGVIFVALILIILIIVGIPNDKWNQLSIYATILLTFGLLYLNSENNYIIREQAKDNNRLIKAQTSPFVYVSLKKADDPPWLISLCIENIGLGVAKDIKIEIQDDFITETGPLTNYPLFRNGLAYLAPKEKKEPVIIDFKKRVYSEFQDVKLIIKVKFKSMENEEFENEYPLSFSEFNLMRYLPSIGNSVYISGNIKNLTQAATTDLNDSTYTNNKD
jgi:hypothetical protein